MGSQEIVVVTDSASSLPLALQRRYSVTVVPCRLLIGGKEYLEGVSISPPKVVAAVFAGETVEVITPSTAEFAAVYARLADLGAKQIVSVHLSSRLAPAVDDAREAATHSRRPVLVFDSGTVAMAQGFVVLAGASVAAAGGSLEQVVAAMEATGDGSRLMSTVTTTDYGYRHGRVSWLGKTIFNAARIRPILAIRDGKMRMVDRARGTDAARAKVRDTMTSHISSLDNPGVAVSLIGGVVAQDGLALDVAGVMADVSPGASLTAFAGPGAYVIAAAPMPGKFSL